MLLSIKQYSNWQEIQDEYEDYTASLNFASIEEIADYILMDYELSPEKLEAQFNKLNDATNETIEIEL